MAVHQNFLRFASICCWLTVLTTLGIHLFFPDPPADFYQRVLLFRDKTYIINRWWVIVHCLLVIIAMCGFGILLVKKSAGFSILGFLFFALFSIAEITRQMFVLFYINELRQQYVALTDPVMRDTLKFAITNAGLITAPLFGLFIFAFALGNLCYGICLVRETGFSKILSILLIAWACIGFIGLGNSFWKVSSIDLFIEKYSFTFQPFVRAVMATWLWRSVSETKG